jgi:dipeptidyl aminopeptidase/acylaminoacyl peptidase
LLSGRTLADGVDGQPDISISADGRRMACAAGDSTHPWDIWAGELGGELRQLTSFNAHLRDVALGAAEVLRWEAPDGLEIEGILIYPSGYTAGQRGPLVVDVHGGPSWQWLDRFMASWHDWAQWLAAQGYAVLLPNPRGSTGRGREFNHRNHRNWGHGDLDDILSGVASLVTRGIADPARLGICGWSYGGYMTAWAIGQTHQFKAAIVGAGVTDLLSFQASDIPHWLPRNQMLAEPYDDQAIYLRCSPITYVANAQTPTLILHGEKDERVRLGQARELYHALRSRGIPVDMVTYPRESHVFTEVRHQRDVLDRIAAWFRRWLVQAPDNGRDNHEP